MRRLCLAALAAFSVASAQELVMRLDPADTTVTFTLPDVLHTVHGTFKLRRGEVRFDPATGKAAGELVVDASSGSSGSNARDRRMHQNILESARYPDIVFAPARVEGKVAPQGVSEVRVYGIFRIHGAEHEIVLPVKVEAGPDALTASTGFEVPYVKWGMKNPSTLFLRVGDKVAISIRAVARSTHPAGESQTSVLLEDATVHHNR